MAIDSDRQRRRKASGRCRRVPAALAAYLLLPWGPGVPAQAAAERLAVEVRNERGDPVQDAVVYAVATAPAEKVVPAPEPVVIDQVDKEFVPYVTAVPVGTRVAFPNRDQIRHHVYSFSEAKAFEIPLYKGMPPELVEFDAPGEVALGCNIHDWMKAWIFVSETPYFGVTDAEGAAELELPSGDYRVEVWHPRRKGDPETSGRHLRVAAGAGLALELSIEQRPLFTPRRAPSLSDAHYR